MEHIVKFEKRVGVDVGYHESVIDPVDRESCVGIRGIDKSLTLQQVLSLAYKNYHKPNIIIKAGPNAKWYFKCYPVNKIEHEIEKQRWRNTSRCTMYIIEWE